MSIHHVLLDPNYRPVIAHRGASEFAPENTVPALQLGVDQGADALEFDLHLAACGTPVLIHDPELDRTSSATGKVSDHTVTQLQRFDAGHRFPGGERTFPWRDRGVVIPTLSEVLDRFPTVPMLIELKTVEVAEPARRVLLKHNAAGRVVLASFLEAALRPFRGGPFVTSASRIGILRLRLRSALGLGCKGPDLAYSVPERYRNLITIPTPALIKAARTAGRPVHVWTVDDPIRANDLWNGGVSGIITNVPSTILASRHPGATR